MTRANSSRLFAPVKCAKPWASSTQGLGMQAAIPSSQLFGPLAGSAGEEDSLHIPTGACAVSP
eukprot:9754995-Alexandrium_andersonii.AAC.1